MQWFTKIDKYEVLRAGAALTFLGMEWKYFLLVFWIGVLENSLPPCVTSNKISKLDSILRLQLLNKDTWKISAEMDFSIWGIELETLVTNFVFLTSKSHISTPFPRCLMSTSYKKRSTNLQCPHPTQPRQCRWARATRGRWRSWRGPQTPEYTPLSQLAWPGLMDGRERLMCRPPLWIWLMNWIVQDCK